MLIDDFKTRYTTIPFATYSHKYEKQNGKDIDTLFHMHKEIEVLSVSEGKAKLFTDTDVLDIEKGDVVFIPPYVLHRYRIIAESGFEHSCICFDAELLQNEKLKKGLEDKTVSITNVVGNENYAKYVNEAVRADLNKTNGWEMRVIGNLCIMFSEMIEKGYVKSVATPLKSSVYYKITDYIARNFTSDITSADIAGKIHMNSSYFCRLFKRNFGYPFQSYLCMYRIEKSKPLLKNTDMTVSEIAAAVGFNSQSFFGKEFKRYNGLTPREFRKQKRLER